MLSFEEGECLLKEMGLTSKDLDQMWETCVNADHQKIAQLHKSGVGWRDLNPNAIKTLPREFFKIIEKEILL